MPLEPARSPASSSIIQFDPHSTYGAAMVEPRRREVQPPELAALLDLAERPRAGEWSLRAALTRYAQPEPRRVSDLLDLVRRIDAVTAAEQRTIAAQGPELWAALTEALRRPRTATGMVGVLEAMVELDRLGDTLAAWATDPSIGAPDDAVDAVTAEVRERLATLGVPEQQDPRAGPRRRGA
jgi:hypothetical protein